jgi:hypothetical protein
MVVWNSNDWVDFLNFEFNLLQSFFVSFNMSLLTQQRYKLLFGYL